MLKETSSSRKIKLVPEDTKFLASFVGELNGNIKLLEENLSVKIFQNGNKISIKGEKNKLDHAEHIIKTLYLHVAMVAISQKKLYTLRLTITFLVILKKCKSLKLQENK